MNYKKLIKNISNAIKKAINENDLALSDVHYEDQPNKNGLSIEVEFNTSNSNDYNVEYIFDDLRQIPFEERQSQYETPIELYAGGAGYGHNITFLNEGKTIKVNNPATKTESVEYTIKEMHSLFQLNGWQAKAVWKVQENNVKVMYIIADLFTNKSVLIEAMECYGWSYATTKHLCLDGHNWIMVSFDPIFQDNVNEEVKKNPVLKHWTPLYRYGNIIKEGLIPKSDNYNFSYPPKIHLIKGNTNENNIMNIGYKLYDANKNTQNNGHYILLDVDTRKIKENIDFFYDPRYEHGYYTKQPINKETLSKNKEINFKQ